MAVASAAMFTRINAKQEQFLLFVIDGLPASRAYAKVYGEDRSVKVCEANASRLLSMAKVAQRRQELIAARHARTPISLEFLTTELMDQTRQAKALGQMSAATAATMGVAKLHGLLVDQVKIDALVRKPSASPESPDEMSEQDWLTTYGKPTLTLEVLQPEHNQLTPTDKTEQVVQPSEPEGSE